MAQARSVRMVDMLQKSKCRVLVVDDNAPVRMLLRELLRNEGVASISEAENGVEALAHLEERPFDIVFADLEMPTMGGMELMRTVREEKIIYNSQIPFVFVTAHANPDLVAMARSLGVAGYLVKPISSGQLRAKLDQALRIAQKLMDQDARPSKGADTWDL